MADKANTREWTTEERELAALQVAVRETTGPGFASADPDLVQGLREMLARQALKAKETSTSGVAVTLQCELNDEREKAKAMFDAYQALVSTPEAAGREDESRDEAMYEAYCAGYSEREKKHSMCTYSGFLRQIKPTLNLAAPPSGEPASTPEAAGRSDGWIPVADGLPKHGGQVEITFWLNEHNGPFVTLARHEKGRWDWNSVFANAHRRDEDVTAWRDLPRPYQPKSTLPAPPSEAKAKEGVDDDPR